MAEGQKIITVTQGGILYRDEKSIVQWIDFKACNANWVKGYKKPLEEEARIVGWRHYYLPYVELATEPKIRLEFANIDEADHQLLVPMYRHGGWYTWLHVAEPLPEDEVSSENETTPEDEIPLEDMMLSKPLLIFVAGPYCNPDSVDRTANVNAVRKVVKQLMLKGHFVLDGHWLLHTFFGDDQIDNDEIMRQTLSWLERCDAIYVLDKSAGVEREIEKAQELNLQVFNSLDEVLQADGSDYETKPV